jgi:hypothetical protein
MKRITNLLVLLMLITVATVAQDQKPQENKPLSPKETVKGKAGAANVEIVYSRPSARGRTMIGGNEPFGERARMRPLPFNSTRL